MEAPNTRTRQVQAGLVFLLLVAGLASFVPAPASFTLVETNRYAIALIAFGITNIVWTPRGTFYVRAVAVVAAFAGLLFSGTQVLAGLYAWLVWPPALMVSWALTRNADLDSEESPSSEASVARARLALAALIGAVAIATIAFRLIVSQNLQQTAVLFVGIPSLLAIIVVFSTTPRTATGVACKAVTVGLLVSMLFLGEGMVCVVMSAPIFYALAIGIAALMDSARQRNYKPPTTMIGMILLVIVPMSLEGVTPLTTLNRRESVSETKIVRAVPEEIARALFEQPRFDRRLPLYLRGGFPNAIATRIESNAEGMRWVIRVRGGEMRLNGMEPRTGELILALEESHPGLVRWRALSDTSHMTHFLTWREITVRWSAVDAGYSTVTWTLDYDRGLDPAWYFGPWERYAARLAAGYLIDSVATP